MRESNKGRSTTRRPKSIRYDGPPDPLSTLDFSESLQHVTESAQLISRRTGRIDRTSPPLDRHPRSPHPLPTFTSPHPSRTLAVHASPSSPSPRATTSTRCCHLRRGSWLPDGGGGGGWRSGSVLLGWRSGFFRVLWEAERTRSSWSASATLPGLLRAREG